MTTTASGVIERYVQLMTDHLPAHLRPAPCDMMVIERVRREFRRALGIDLPDAYCRALAVADGVDHNGLTLWPVQHHVPPFRQTLIEANLDLRDSFDENYIYLAQLDEELYVYDSRTHEYLAIEFVGRPVWAKFASAEQMLAFVLERAWGQPLT